MIQQSSSVQCFFLVYIREFDDVTQEGMILVGGDVDGFCSIVEMGSGDGVRNWCLPFVVLLCSKRLTVLWSMERSKVIGSELRDAITHADVGLRNKGWT